MSANEQIKLKQSLMEGEKSNMDSIVELRKERKENRQFSKNGNDNKGELNSPGTCSSVVEVHLSQSMAGNKTTLKSMAMSSCDQEATGIQNPEGVAACKAALKRIAKELRGDNLKRQWKAIQSLSKMICTRDQLPTETVVKTGIISKCVEFLKNDVNLELQCEAASILSCFAQEGEMQAEIMVKAGAVDPLTDMLKSAEFSNVDAAVMALGSIAAYGSHVNVGNEEVHIRIVSSLAALVATLEDVEWIQNVAWALERFCTTYGQVWPPQVAKLCIPGLIDLITTPDEGIVCIACLALKSLSEASDEVVDELAQQAIESGIVPRLVQLVDSPNSHVNASCLVIIGNIGNSELLTQTLIDFELLPCLTKVLKSTNTTAVGFAVFIARNIADQSISQMLALVHADIVPLLVDAFNTGELDAKKDVVDVIKCIASETEDLINHLFDANAIPALCDMLKIKDVDAILVTLDAISAILKTATVFDHIEKVALAFEECGGLELIDKLQNHENEEVYKMALDIIDKYFSG